MIIDRYDRPVNNLRLSITSRCNLNCFYCHREGNSGLKTQEMTVEELGRIGYIASELGINKIKILKVSQ